MAVVAVIPSVVFNIDALISSTFAVTVVHVVTVVTGVNTDFAAIVVIVTRVVIVAVFTAVTYNKYKKKTNPEQCG